MDWIVWPVLLCVNWYVWPTTNVHFVCSVAGTGVRSVGKRLRSNWRQSAMVHSCYETAPTTAIFLVSVSEHSTLLITLASNTTKVCCCCCCWVWCWWRWLQSSVKYYFSILSRSIYIYYTNDFKDLSQSTVNIFILQQFASALEQRCVRNATPVSCMNTSLKNAISWIVKVLLVRTDYRNMS